MSESTPFIILVVGMILILVGYGIGISNLAGKTINADEATKAQLLRAQTRNIELNSKIAELTATIFSISNDFMEMSSVARDALDKLNEMEIENASLQLQLAHKDDEVS